VSGGKTPKCDHCGGNVKPDIVFFGEDLPDRFHRLLKQDIPKADLLLVMGTSLNVAPVSMIPEMVRCNRVLFNRDKVMKIRKGRDMFIPGDCDANAKELIDLLGWTVNENPTPTKAKEDSATTQNNDDNNNEENFEKLFASIDIKDDDDKKNQKPK